MVASNNHTFALRVHVWDEEGRLRATLDAPGNNLFDLSVKEICVEAGKLYLKRLNSSGAEIVLEGQMRDGVVTGTYADDGEKAGVFLLSKSNKQVVKHQASPSRPGACLGRRAHGA